MAITNTDRETINSAMALAAGVFAFFAAVIPIINDKFKKVKITAQSERDVDSFFRYAVLSFAVGGFCFDIFTSASKVSTRLYIAASLIYVLGFIIRKGTPQRPEIVYLAFWVSFFSILCLSLVFNEIWHQVSEVEQISDQHTEILEKLENFNQREISLIERLATNNVPKAPLKISHKH
jgi:predicted PurR-regulated permease PerM